MSLTVVLLHCGAQGCGRDSEVWGANVPSPVLYETAHVKDRLPL